MSPDLDHFRDALETERKRVSDALQYLHDEEPQADGDEAQESRMDNHMADGASITYDREIDYSLEENAEQLLEEIDAALQRIDEGTYGKCRRCGKEIAVERLEAIPYAQHCIDCARETRA